jgi:HSP20 family protein
MRIIRYQTPSHRSFSPASGYYRSPWSGLETEIDRLFNSVISEGAKSVASGRFNVDLYQDDHNAYVRAELPGFTRDTISVEVVEGHLTIEAKREAKNETAQSAAKFNRSVALPDDVKADAVAATYVDGVLTVTLPKKEAAKPRKIAVAVR